MFIAQDSTGVNCNTTFTQTVQDNTAYISNMPSSGQLSFGTGISVAVGAGGHTNYTYPTAGVYDICFQDSAQLCPPRCQTITIADSIPPCNLNFTYAIQGNTAYFTNTSNIPNSTILNFGDGTNSVFPAGSTIYHTYSNASNYIVCLTDSLQICPMFCQSIPVQVDSANCNYSFSYAAQSNTISFTNTSVGMPHASYAVIAFGDGSLSVFYGGNTVSHTYAPNAYYTVCINDSLGQCPAHCSTIYVTLADTCDLRFTQIVQGNTVTFTNTATYSAGGILGVNGVNTYLAAGQSITRTFTEGSYQACLWDSTGNCSEYCKTFSIAPANNCTGLQAHLNITTQGLTATANASVTGLANGMPINVRIAVNNGNVLQSSTSVSSGLQIGYTNTFAQAGTYRICAFVRLPDGSCQDSICQNVTVGAQQCVADFYYNHDSTSQTSHTVYFQSLDATPWITNAHWDFGDGTVSNDLNPTHTFQDSGYYRVCLVATNTSPCPSVQQNCRDSICKYIHFCHNLTATSAQTALANRVTIFPNPSTNHNIVTVRLDNLTAQQITVYNTLGQTLIQQRTNSDNTIPLDTTSFAAGLYSVELQTDKGKVVKKMVLQ